MIRRLMILALAAAPLFAAGTVVITPPRQLGQSGFYTLTWSWTGDASTGNVPASSAGGSLDTGLLGYRVVQVEFIPGSGTAPTNNYSATITDKYGLDVLAGAAAADLSSTVATGYSVSSSTGMPVSGTLTLNITGNSVASATGTVIAYLCPPSLARLFGGSGSASGVTQLVAGTGISLAPLGGTGVVTITATGSGTGNVTVYTGSGAPGSVSGNIQGSIYLDTSTNSGTNMYECFHSGSAPACTAVGAGSWVLVSGAACGTGTLCSFVSGQVSIAADPNYINTQIQTGGATSCITSADTSTAYLCALSPSISAAGYSQNMVLQVVFDVASGASPTLAVNGLAPIPLDWNVNGTLVAVAANELSAGPPYTLIAYGSPVTNFLVTPAKGVNSGSANSLGYYSATGTAVSPLAPCASGVLIYSALDVPSCSPTLPVGLTIPGAAAISTGSGAPTCTGGMICFGETTVGTGKAAGVDVIYGDSTSHALFASFNNNPYAQVATWLANNFTGLQNITLAPGANTTNDGLQLYNTTAATSGNAQYSPAIHLQGNFWNGSSITGYVQEYLTDYLGINGTLSYQVVANYGGTSQKLFHILAFGGSSGSPSVFGIDVSGLSIGSANFVYNYNGLLTLQNYNFTGTYGFGLGLASASWPGLAAVGQTNPVLQVVDNALGSTAQLQVAGTQATGAGDVNVCWTTTGIFTKGAGCGSATGTGVNVNATSPTLTTPVISSIVNTGTETIPSTSGGIPIMIACGTTSGATANCANTAVGATAKIYFGKATLATNASVITISPGFTSATTYYCEGNDVTTRANAVQVVPTSGTTLTITDTTGATDAIQWVCQGY